MCIHNLDMSIPTHHCIMFQCGVSVYLCKCVSKPFLQATIDSDICFSGHREVDRTEAMSASLPQNYMFDVFMFRVSFTDNSRQLRAAHISNVILLFPAQSIQIKERPPSDKSYRAYDLIVWGITNSRPIAWGAQLSSGDAKMISRLSDFYCTPISSLIWQ